MPRISKQDLFCQGLSTQCGLGGSQICSPPSRALSNYHRGLVLISQAFLIFNNKLVLKVLQGAPRPQSLTDFVCVTVGQMTKLACVVQAREDGKDGDHCAAPRRASSQHCVL